MLGFKRAVRKKKQFYGKEKKKSVLSKDLEKLYNKTDGMGC